MLIIVAVASVLVFTVVSYQNVMGVALIEVEEEVEAENAIIITNQTGNGNITGTNSTS